VTYHDENVRAHTRVLHGEHLASAPEAGLHLRTGSVFSASVMRMQY
jgi:hypothetical protein